MFDLGFTELLLIGIVALIVVGPKDLPGLFRSVGKFIGKAKGMAREFSSTMSDAADDAGMKDAASGLSDLKNLANPSKLGLDKLKEATDEFTKWTHRTQPPAARPKSLRMSGRKRPRKSTRPPPKKPRNAKLPKRSKRHRPKVENRRRNRRRNQCPKL
jgi:sec-independent protein translocase protein TatB